MITHLEIIRPPNTESTQKRIKILTQAKIGHTFKAFEYSSLSTVIVGWPTHPQPLPVRIHKINGKSPSDMIGQLLSFPNGDNASLTKYKGETDKIWHLYNIIQMEPFSKTHTTNWLILMVPEELKKEPEASNHPDELTPDDEIWK